MMLAVPDVKPTRQRPACRHVPAVQAGRRSLALPDLGGRLQQTAVFAQGQVQARHQGLQLLVVLVGQQGFLPTGVGRKSG